MLNITPLSKISKQGIIGACNQKFIDLFAPLEVHPTQTSLYSLIEDSDKFKDSSNLIRTLKAVFESCPEESPDSVYYMLYESTILLGNNVKRLVIWSDIDESFFGIYTKDTELDLFKQFQTISSADIYKSMVLSINNRLKNLEDVEDKIKKANQVLNGSKL